MKQPLYDEFTDIHTIRILKDSVINLILLSWLVSHVQLFYMFIYFDFGKLGNSFLDFCLLFKAGPPVMTVHLYLLSGESEDM